MQDHQGTEISCLANPAARSGSPGTPTLDFSSPVARTVRRFHRTAPGYAPTPLVSLKNLARLLGIADIRVKDESSRFGLKAFKALGALYAVARVLAERLNLGKRDLSMDLFASPEVRRNLKDVTFVTATDGNHGRAVAWTAGLLGCGAVVYMPRGSSEARVEAIRGHGARVSVIDGNYDDAVRLAAGKAEEKDWILLQDTALEGSVEIPLWVTQGYLTMVEEILEQWRGERPTHVFVQCGVGSFGASIQARFQELFGPERPLFAAVEPFRAACLYESMRSGDGNPRRIEGPLDTIMAGLACGEPNPAAWKILRDYTDYFMTCSDDVAAKGMRVLGRPMPGDDPVLSGESGAVTLGLVHTVLSNPAFRDIAATLKLDSRSRVLVFSTEGDTDPAAYRRIMAGEDRPYQEPPG